VHDLVCSLLVGSRNEVIWLAGSSVRRRGLDLYVSLAGGKVFQFGETGALAILLGWLGRHTKSI
jgi:hypothetical protein